MPQPIANNILSKPISGSIERADMSLAIEGEGRDYRGNYSGLEWYSSITPIDGKYVIVSKSVGTGLPTHWVTADETDAELLYTVNRLPDVANSQTFNDTGSALDWLTTSDRYIVLRSMPNNSDADGLLFSLDANNVSSYPRKGTTWFDINGGGKDIDLFNGPSFNANGYLDFDGTNDYGRLPGGGLSTTAYTKIAWFNPDGVTNNIISGGSGDGQHAFWMNGTNNFLRAGHNGSWSTVSYSPGVMTGKWWFGAVTFNTTTGWKLYMNGEVVDTSSNTSTFSGGNAIRIAAYNDAGNLFNGQIATAQVYNRVLSDDDIKQNYFGGPIVTDGLIFAVDPSNLVSYENGSTTTYQLTGSANNGTLYNGTGYLPDNGGVWEFDGTNDYIEFTSGISTPTANLTTVTWVKLDSYLAQNSTIGIHPDGNTNGGVRIYAISPTSLGVWMRDSGGSAPSISTSNGIPLNEWTQITFVNNNGVGKLYKNGVEIVSSTFSSTPVALNNVNAWISRFSGGGYYIDGKVGSTMLYNRALTPEEVGQNYNAQKQKYQL